MNVPATEPKPRRPFRWRVTLILSLACGFAIAIFSPILLYFPVANYIPFMVFRLGEAVFASPGFAEVWPFARPVAAALILSVFIFVPLFFSHFVNEFAKPVPKTHIRVLLLRGLIVGTILGILTMAISHFSISPSEVQGVNLRLDSFRYRFGVWLDGINGPLCVFCAWPAFIYGVLGNGPLGYIGLFFCTLIAGFGWVMLWDKLRRAFTGFFKVPWARN